MKSEKVKEIKDNITVCTTKIGCNGCSLLPIMASTNCRNKLLEDALNLINELESENARLANRITYRVTIPDNKLEKIKKECIERVEIDKEKLLKQFAERLKERLKDNVNGDNVDYYVECAIYIDETLKDFINQDKNYTEVR